jgi:hypothetical protein
MITVNCWTLYAHPLFLEQLEKLTKAVEKRARVARRIIKNPLCHDRRRPWFQPRTADAISRQSDAQSTMLAAPSIHLRFKEQNY